MTTRILLATALALAPLASTTAHAQSTFPDVPDGHWAASAVRRLAEAGIIEGFPATQERRAPRPIAEAPQGTPQDAAQDPAPVALKPVAAAPKATAKVKAARAPRAASAGVRAPSKRTAARASARSAR